MRMKESTGSLKAYFIVIAVILLIQNLRTLSLASMSPLFAIIGIIGLAFAIAYFYIGFILRRLLARSPRTIKYIIYASVAFEILLFIIGLLGSGLIAAAVIIAAVRLIFSLLIAWYLIRNVNRLAGQEQSKFGVQSPSK